MRPSVLFSLLSIRKNSRSNTITLISQRHCQNLVVPSNVLPSSILHRRPLSCSYVSSDFISFRSDPIFCESLVYKNPGTLFPFSQKKKIFPSQSSNQRKDKFTNKKVSSKSKRFRLFILLLQE